MSTDDIDIFSVVLTFTWYHWGEKTPAEETSIIKFWLLWLNWSARYPWPASQRSAKCDRLWVAANCDCRRECLIWAWIVFCVSPDRFFFNDFSSSFCCRLHFTCEEISFLFCQAQDNDNIFHTFPCPAALLLRPSILESCCRKGVCKART